MGSCTYEVSIFLAILTPLNPVSKCQHLDEAPTPLEISILYVHQIEAPKDYEEVCKMAIYIAHHKVNSKQSPAPDNGEFFF